ncbi:MAG: hypothetical protein A3A77_01385 [Candidatus Blackburnbacteria bacterium RIFCSPLOWO2_01_FULL_40_20]|uniref:Uncharacterized protein n=1 Tax=Candidatus Blackburnbacteria bacterium RIFCSPLOWO2_01_FULL_40_20 TaxID=1797519 RepID=A0A1G1VE27_9BACT|nr:MAG: hypothetical protein A3A77_01385 [Candidatus Blackburnbacteria bacterium RIFCSPLOWO2_01_FULL_40_20]
MLSTATQAAEDEKDNESSSGGTFFLANISTEKVLPIGLIGGGLIFIGISAASFLKGKHSDTIDDQND